MSGRLGTFLIGAVAGVGFSQFYGPFFRTLKHEVKSQARNIKKEAQNIYEDVKDKAVQLKHTAKQKYQDAKSDMKEKIRK